MKLNLLFSFLILISLESKALYFEGDENFERCMQSAQDAISPGGFVVGEPYENYTTVLAGPNQTQSILTSIAIKNYFFLSSGRFDFQGYNCIHNILPTETKSIISMSRKGLESQTKACGSVINYVKKTLSESIPLAGTDFTINYSSEYNSKIDLQRTISRDYKSVTDPGIHQISISDSQSQPLFQTQFLTGSGALNWVWDGVTGNISSNHYMSKLKVSVVLGRNINIPNSVIGCKVPTLFCDPDLPRTLPNPLFVTRARDSDSISIYHPEVWGLKGWTISAHHYFDSDAKILYSGEGEKIYYDALVQTSLPSYGIVNLVNKRNTNDEIYIFDLNGKHLETRTGITSAVKYKFNYDSADKLVSIIDIHNKITELIYDNSGKLLKIKAPYGQETSFISNQDQLLSASLPGDQKYDMSYNEKNLLTSFSKPNQEKTLFTYTASGEFLREDKNTNLYQEFRNSISQTMTIFQNLVGYGIKLITEVEYNADFQVSALKTANGELISKQTHSQITGQDDLVENEKTSSILKNPHPVWGNDFKTVQSVRNVYTDDQNSVDEKIQHSEQYLYSNTANPFSLYRISISDFSNSVTSAETQTIDISTRTITLRSKNQLYSFVYFNSKEQITRIEPALGFPIDYSYDLDGRLNQIKKGSQSESYSYGTDGLLNSITNSKNQTTYFIRNAQGLVMQKILPNQEVIRFEYTTGGELSKIITSANQSHNFTLGLGDYLQSYLNPDNKNTTYEYDSDKRITQIIKPSQRKIQFNYKPQSQYLASLNTNSGNYLFNAIDSSGRPHQIVSPDQITVEMNWLSDQVKQQKWYDLDGSVIATLSNTYTSDQLRIENILLNNQVIANYGYMLNTGQLRTLNNSTYSYTYNQGQYFSYQTQIKNGSLTSVYESQDTANGNTPIQYVSTTATEIPNRQLFISMKRSFDNFGQASEYSLTTTNTNLGVLNSFYELIPTYDQNSRLIEIQKNKKSYVNDQVVSTTELSNKYDFKINSNNNLKEFSQQVLQGSPAIKRTLASHGADDKLISLRGSVNRDYSYDDDGNLKTMSNCYGTTTYQYDDFSNLKQINFPNGKVIQYKTDGLNRRIKKIVNGITKEYYLWHDQIRLAAILDENKVPKLIYLYGAESNSPSLLIKDQVTYKIIHTPGLGSIRYIINTTTSEIAQEIDYDEYGNAIKNTDPKFQPLTYAGGLSDEDTRFIRFGARDYDPTIGRWTAKDPIGFNGGDTNLYAYVGGNPMSRIDPNGLWGIGVIGGGSGEAGLIIGGGATGSVGGGVFGGGATGTNIGGFGGGGAFGGGPGLGAGAPACKDNKTGVVGAFAGVGAGIFISNATNVSQLGGYSNTYSINVGVGPVKISGQIGISGDIWLGSITFGPGVGLSGSTYPTFTGTAGGN